MLLITCPHCGPRSAGEFTHRGETPTRPAPDGATPAEWRDYLYTRDNAAGVVTEEWFHTSGCRRFLVIERNTTTNEIHDVRERS